MKKIFMIFLLGFSFFGQCNWINYSASTSDGMACVNGVCMPCNGSASIINGEIFCNGQKVTQSNNNNSIKGSGKAKTKKVSLKKIKKISASGRGNLFIKQCEDPNNCIEMLDITADDNIIEYLSDINGNRLELGINNNVSISPKIPIRYNVIVKDINSISAFDDITVEVSNIAIDQLDISSNGISNVDIENVNAHELIINSCGKSKITINGKVETQKIYLSGGADYDAHQLESKIAHINMSGASMARLSITEKIKGYVLGGACVLYNKKYNPKINVNVFGAAKIRAFSQE